MLYKYEYVRKHPLYGLNKHLCYFFRKISRISKEADFNTKEYFHPFFTSILDDSPVLKEKFEAFFESYKKLDAVKKEDFYKMVIKCQSIEKIFEDTTIRCIDFNTDSVKALINDGSLSNLTNYLFTTTLKTTRWQIEDHYKQIYDKMPPHKACPFCGVGDMHSTFREDYDHLAPKKYYPLLAVNPKNLVPMCGACNSKFKGEVDVLYKNNIRRVFAYPYLTTLNISFDYSKSIIPDTDLDNEEGNWEILISPNNDFTSTWKDVFQIEKRYINDYIKPKFDSWIGHFVDTVIEYDKKIDNIEQLKCEFARAARVLGNDLLSHSNIIQAPLFDFLSKCNNEVFYNSVLRRIKEKLDKKQTT